jgi:glycerol-3-phosphate acyltransferase PlsY
MSLVVGCVLAWLLGGIPFGLVLVRLLKGVDIRTIGSGNVGATNASRAFSGWRQRAVFVAIYLLDFAKGFVPAWSGPHWTGHHDGWAAVALGAAAIAGHCASPYLRLRGGKGVATSMGVVAAVEWLPLLVALAAFVLAWRATRQVYLGSLALGVTLPVAVIARQPATAFAERLPATSLALALAALLFVTHRTNLQRAAQRRRAAAAGGAADSWRAPSPR